MDARSGPEIDAATGVATTGHEWDGIRELNNPLPRWWLWVFYACIVWSVGYWVVYPSWPLVSGYAGGVLGWSSRESVDEALAALGAQRGTLMTKLAETPVVEANADPQLLAFSQALGRTAFGDNCAPCHGAGGGGARGYPNLVDDDWVWGGSLEQIQQTITHGVRNADADSRQGVMPAFVRDGMLPAEEVPVVVEYVRSIAGLDVLPGADLAKGKEIFEANCASCHGPEGHGNQELGAPSLVDPIWLYGADRKDMIETVRNGRGGVMPAWGGRLDPTTIKALTIYVHALGGGA
jgi:cytochrome c oxidase cbb3-type subunit 3